MTLRDKIFLAHMQASKKSRKARDGLYESNNDDCYTISIDGPRWENRESSERHEQDSSSISDLDLKSDRKGAL